MGNLPLLSWYWHSYASTSIRNGWINLSELCLFSDSGPSQHSKRSEFLGCAAHFTSLWEHFRISSVVNWGEAFCWRKACSSAWSSRTDSWRRFDRFVHLLPPPLTAAHFLILATSRISQHIPLASLGRKLSGREISHFCGAVHSAALSFAW